MNITELASRFEFYAQKNKKILHKPENAKKAFLQLDIQDVQVSIREGLAFPCLLFILPEVEKDNAPDAIIEHYEGSFVILQKLLANAPAATKMNQLYECKLIADQVYNRMLVDSDEYFEGANIKTAEGSFPSMVSAGIIGWAMNFSFDQAYNGELNSDDWEDLQ